MNINRIDSAAFRLPDGPLVTPVEYLHYKLPVLGFRIGNFAYITDIKTIDEREISKLKGLDYLILDCLRYQEHISHFNLEESLTFIELVQPKQAYLTHISHLFDKHEEIKKVLPKNVYPAYDGLTFDAGIAE